MLKKIFGLGLGVALLSNSVANAQDIMTPTELKGGMIGKAITTTTGNELTTFNVEIIGVVPMGKGLPPQILAKAYGGIIPSTNGVIHGMSGSPVFVDGKLVGAIARGVGNDVLPYKFYITPITAMEKIWSMPDMMANVNKIGVKEVKVLPPAKQAKELKKEKEDLQKEIALILGKDKDKIFGENAEVGTAETALAKLAEAKNPEKPEIKSKDEVALVKEIKDFFNDLMAAVKKIVGHNDEGQSTKEASGEDAGDITSKDKEQGTKADTISPKIKDEANSSVDVSGDGGLNKDQQDNDKTEVKDLNVNKEDKENRAKEEIKEVKAVEKAEETKTDVVNTDKTAKATAKTADKISTEKAKSNEQDQTLVVKDKAKSTTKEQEAEDNTLNKEVKTPIKVMEYNISISTPLDQRGLNMYELLDDDKAPEEVKGEETTSEEVDDLIPSDKAEQEITTEKEIVNAIQSSIDATEQGKKDVINLPAVEINTEENKDSKEVNKKASQEEPKQESDKVALEQDNKNTEDITAEISEKASDKLIAELKAEAKENEAKEAKKHENKEVKAGNKTKHLPYQVATTKVKAEAKGEVREKRKQDDSEAVRIITPDDIEAELAKGNRNATLSMTKYRQWRWANKLAHREPLFTPYGEVHSFITGFSPQGKRFLQKMIGATKGGFAGEQGVEIPYDSDVILDYPLKAGEPLSATVAYGDFAIGATGTVTKVEGNKVLSFGHPMFYKGNVNYFMNSAKVIDSAGGILDGIQVASIGKIIGRINQDRYSGIAGVLNVFPASVPVRVKVIDIDNQEEMDYGVKVAYDEVNLVPLVPSIVYGAMSRTADRELSGSARIGFAIANNISPDGVFRRSNMYYSAGDVGDAAVAELTDAISALVSNKEAVSNIYDVNVEIRLTSQRKTATITSVTADKMDIHPGEIVTFSITLQPYRSGERIISIPYLIPEDQPKGPMIFEVKGGGFVRVSELMEDNANLTMAKIGDEQEETTLDKLDKIASTGRNNEIIINPIMDLTTADDLDKAIENAFKFSQKLDGLSPAERDKLLKSKEVIHRTQYVVDNVRHITLNILKKKNKIGK